jgi:hypothetical protein
MKTKIMNTLLIIGTILLSLASLSRGHLLNTLDSSRIFRTALFLGVTMYYLAKESKYGYYLCIYYGFSALLFKVLTAKVFPYFPLNYQIIYIVDLAIVLGYIVLAFLANRRLKHA